MYFSLYGNIERRFHCSRISVREAFVKFRKSIALLAAAGLAAAPTAASSAASSLSVERAVAARAGADMSGSSELRGRRSASMVIGLTILVILIAIALSNGDGPDSP